MQAMDLPISVFDPKVSENRTRGGTHRFKHTIRAGFRAISFLAMIALVCMYNFFTTSGDEHTRRRLQEDSIPAVSGTEERELDFFEDIFQEKADPIGMVIVYILGVLYLFLALAIVCDEFFVPALEIMSDADHMNLSMDIAGATLMAAGGSAPELFTSIIGTFKRSEVGFGTIVGSAVFNVLFVIAMCALCSNETLQLTWWPLARDCTYYVIGLLTLAIFVGVVTPEEIELWEALILFGMYFGYVILMAYNRNLYTLITGEKLEDELGDVPSSDKPISFNYPHTFRAGLLSFIQNPDDWKDKARIGFLYGISGDVDQVFNSVDSNRDGDIDKNELKECFEGLEVTMTENEIDEVMREIDTDGDGKVKRSEFKVWYLHSETLIKKKVKNLFDSYDKNDSASISQDEFLHMLQEVDPTSDEEGRTEAANACFREGQYEVSFEEFSDWYFSSVFYEKQQQKISEEEEPVDEGAFAKLSPPEEGSCYQYVKYIVLFPIVASLVLTIPDCTRPKMGNWCYFAFFLSIAWIGVYSFFMVGWAETIGETAGIPTYIMGLTFLAAGTSVPDLLSSVIVARMGEGDMAVSSSIGSNIFDILVGLPFPWLIFIMWDNDENTVTIGAEGIWLSILILLAMIVLIIATIHLQGWRLTKPLAYIMFFFYVCFLVQAIVREYA